VDNWKKLTNFRNMVRKKSFGGTFCFSNCHIIGLATGGLVFLVSGLDKMTKTETTKILCGCWGNIVVQQLVAKRTHHTGQQKI
jgi:hypothetical protein